jgi:biotin synthase
MMERREIVGWLRETEPARLAGLWRAADEARRRFVGDEVHLRGLLEFSNRCARQCHYCGLRAGNRKLPRYCMSRNEIVARLRRTPGLGYGTVVLQSGEDPTITAAWMADVVRSIKQETPLAVTLSLGERTEKELAAWREAGADRYFLRFETSNRRLYRRIHPPRQRGGPDRLTLLKTVRELGYEVGSGVMIGVPGQNYNDLARDIEWFGKLQLDMIGVGPYLPHPDTPLGGLAQKAGSPDHWQVPATAAMTYRVIALARLLYPQTNIPSTTALAALQKEQGWERGLTRGANVLMPNITPPQRRALYAIYPGKAEAGAASCSTGRSLEARIRAIGRTVGVGRGDSANYLQRASSPATRW